MPTPLDVKLYEAVKREAKRRFQRWPSAYGSAWLVKEYARRGGTFEEERRGPKRDGVHRWMKEQWIQVLPALESPPRIVACGDPRRSGKACRPLRRISPRTPPTLGEVVARHGKDKVRSLARRKSKTMSRRVSWKGGRISRKK